MFNPLNTYRETKIQTASQTELIVMLYDGAINQIKLATEFMAQGHIKFDRINATLGKAQDIITELIASLNMDEGGEIARNLLNLYLFFNEQIKDANVTKNTQQLYDIIYMLEVLRDTWSELPSHV